MAYTYQVSPNYIFWSPVDQIKRTIDDLSLRSLFEHGKIRKFCLKIRTCFGRKYRKRVTGTSADGDVLDSVSACSIMVLCRCLVFELFMQPRRFEIVNQLTAVALIIAPKLAPLGNRALPLTGLTIALRKLWRWGNCHWVTVFEWCNALISAKEQYKKPVFRKTIGEDFGRASCNGEVWREVGFHAFGRASQSEFYCVSLVFICA